MNIPVPDPIPVGSYDELGSADKEPPPKRIRVESNTVSGTKVMMLPSGSVACNTPICELIKVVKPVIRSLVEDCK